jgi:hypothetical protein
MTSNGLTELQYKLARVLFLREGMYSLRDRVFLDSSDKRCNERTGVQFKGLNCVESFKEEVTDAHGKMTLLFKMKRVLVRPNASAQGLKSPQLVPFNPRAQNARAVCPHMRVDGLNPRKGL